MNTNLFLYLIFTTTLFVVTVTVTGQQNNCLDTEWQDPALDCPDDMEEIFTSQDRNVGDYSRRCCKPGTEDASNGHLYAKVCTTTRCVSNEAAQKESNLCDAHLAYRVFIQNQELIFQETVRDQCKGVAGNPDEIGTEVLCCPADSMDMLLTTLYGAEHREFSHFVRLGTGGCGATVYNKRWVLTASHCVTKQDANEQRVWTKDDSEWDGEVGTVRINIDLGDAYTENTYNVEDIIVHPNSSRLQPLDDKRRLYNDIALVKVDRDIEFNENVKALRIPEMGFKPLDHGNWGIIAGFGKTGTLIYSKKLQKANVPIRPTEEFLSYPVMSQMRDYKDQLIFVGGIYKGDYQPAAGQGDSGGPFVCRHANGMAILCGITSFTGPIEICKQNLDQDTCIPTAYVDVQYFTDWIRSIAGDQSDADILQQPLYGKKVPKKKYTSQVHITTDGDESCGGTLIAEDVVVTAASCVADENGNQKKKIRVTSGLRKLEDSGKKIGVKAMAIFPGFKRAKKSNRRKRIISLVLESWQQGKLNISAIAKDPYYKNNLAVLKLSESTGVKDIAKLADSPVMEGDTGTEVAFPLKPMSSADTGRPLSQREFKLLSHSDCQKRLDRLSVIGYHIHLDDNILCGVEKYSGGSMCDRELGGGLFCKGDVLCGIQVFRTCEFNVPNAFMDVANAKVNYWLKSALTAMKDQ